MTLRPAAVAFSFYPGLPDELAQSVDALLAAAPASSAPPPKLLIVPHAGHVYSGSTAAAAYRELQPLRNSIRRVVLLGPTHRVAINGLALPESTAFATPLGTISLDLTACARLAQEADIVRSEAAHADEHSLEVQLPFLQRSLTDFLLIPLAVGRARPETVAAVLDALWDGQETLIIISTDLSHFLPASEACRRDAATCRQILANQTNLQLAQACGAIPLNGALLAAGRRGLRARLLAYRHSGEITGDQQRVVGYASFAISEQGVPEHA